MPTASVATLRQRSLLLGKIRRFFETRQFFHVETPLLSKDTVIDRYIEPVRLSRSSVNDGQQQDKDLFLQTSPEFAMKRLVASGALAIYQICKAFRKGEAGRRHNPEFTMLEWYRVGDDLAAGIELLADFAKYMFESPNWALPIQKLFSTSRQASRRWRKSVRIPGAMKLPRGLSFM